MTSQSISSCLDHFHLPHKATPGVCSPCLGPSLQSSNIPFGEGTLRMCCRDWSAQYDNLLQETSFPSLSRHRKQLKLRYLFQVQNRHSFSPMPSSPASMLTPDSGAVSSCCDPTLLNKPFARTTACQTSFIPDTVSLWYRPPKELHSASSLP